jgi:type I site-specific restriction-modification system R (restriction) subunit
VPRLRGLATRRDNIGSLEPAMEYPTIVVITDRNDLDDQLFGTFARCRDLLRQDPVQAADRADLREKLRVGGGGVVFTTIQKFMPAEQGDRNAVLSDRRNIVVIADEAHRSQYDFIDGFARHMRDALPQASFVGFTGTPIEKADANTLREHAARARARARARSSATTSASTTSSARSKTAPRCRSTTKAGWRSWN